MQEATFERRLYSNQLNATQVSANLAFYREDGHNTRAIRAVHLQGMRGL
jgi:hypothetical protein